MVSNKKNMYIRELMKFFLKKLSLIIKFFLSYIFCCLILIKQAHAYIDPGSIQAFFVLIAGGLVGFFISIKLYWFKIINFFKNLFNKKKSTTDNEKK